MKKRFVSILSILLAFVLCFALAACGNDGVGKGGNSGNGGGNGGGNTEVVTAAEASTQVEKLISAEGYSGVLTLSADTKNTEALTLVVNIKKLGDKLKLNVGAESYIADLKTGYIYMQDGEDVYYRQVLPAGLLDYLPRLLAANDVDFNIESMMPEYDAATKSMTCEFDYAQDVNDVVTPVYDAYKYNKTVKALLDVYAAQLTDNLLDFNGVCLLIDMAVEKYKNDTVADAVKKMSAVPQLGGLAAKIPAELIQKCGDRKIGEMIIGVYDYVMALMAENMPATADDMPEDPTPGEPDSTIHQTLAPKEIIDGLVDALLNNPVDMSTFDAKYAELKNLIQVPLAYNVKDLIDAVTADMPGVKTIIEKSVKLTKLGGKFALKFDENKTLTDIGLELGISHNYTGTPINGLQVLSDNDYTVKAALSVDWTVPAAAEFDVNLERAFGIWGDIYAVADVNSTADYKVYIETAGKTIDSASVRSQLTLPDGTTLTPVIAPTFDKTTGILTVPAASNGGEAKLAVGSMLSTEITIVSGETTYEVYVEIVYLDHDLEHLAGLIQSLIGGSSEMPDDNVEQNPAA